MSHILVIAKEKIPTRKISENYILWITLTFILGVITLSL